MKGWVKPCRALEYEDFLEGVFVGLKKGKSLIMFAGRKIGMKCVLVVIMCLYVCLELCELCLCFWKCNCVCVCVVVAIGHGLGL